jgi:transcriptional regulator with XRE-family HTH domain
MEIKDRIRELRTEKNLTIKQVAAEIGVAPTAICNYEAGIREPSIALIKKMCALFDCSSDYLIGITDSY